MIKFILEVKTNAPSSTHTGHSRVYTLQVLKETEDYKVISLFVHNSTHRDHIDGETRILLLQNKIVKFNDYQINKAIAKLAINYDPLLKHDPASSKKFDFQLILDKLDFYAHQNDEVLIID